MPVVKTTAGTIDSIAASDHAEVAARGRRRLRLFFEQQPFHQFLAKSETGLILDDSLHRELVELFVALRPRRMHGGAFGAIEHPKLDAGRVGDSPHRPAEGVNLANDLSFGDATNGRVTTHLTDGVGVHRQKRSAQPEPGRGEGGFRAGVAAATMTTSKSYVSVAGNIAVDDAPRKAVNCRSGGCSPATIVLAYRLYWPW